MKKTTSTSTFSFDSFFFLFSILHHPRHHLQIRVFFLQRFYLTRVACLLSFFLYPQHSQCPHPSSLLLVLSCCLTHKKIIWQNCFFFHEISWEYYCEWHWKHHKNAFFSRGGSALLLIEIYIFGSVYMCWFSGTLSATYFSNDSIKHALFAVHISPLYLNFIFCRA